MSKIKDFFKGLLLETNEEYKLFNNIICSITLILCAVGMTCATFTNANSVELGFILATIVVLVVYEAVIDIISIKKYNLFK